MTLPESIPYEDYGGDGQMLHFAHANGFPPGAYRQLLEGLSAQHHIVAMRMRPLWPGAQPEAIVNWRPLADDLERFLDQRGLQQVIGWGHSMGALTTLRLALRQPQRFSSLVLIDPVFFPPRAIIFWDLLYRLGLGYRVHPLVKGALKRREDFESREAMYANYRKKSIFQRLNDQALADYTNAMGCSSPDGSVRLCYPARWEARIYVTALRADMEIWRNLPQLKIPLLIVRGAETDTFLESTGRLVQRRLPAARVHTVPDSTHLVALEKPLEILAAVKEIQP